jgi:hypothetical protein
MATTAYTYDNNARREDLLDIITNLTPRETQLLSGLQRSSASDISHQWVKDTLDTVAANAQVEGADATFRTLTNPERLVNYTQIISKPYRISGTDRAVNPAGFDDRLTYEREKGFKSFNNDVEFALMRGTLVCGTGSAARSMMGMKIFLSCNTYGNNNYTSQSGVSMTETMLNDYFQAVWDDGTQVNAVYAPMYLKRKISAFTAGNHKNVQADDKRLVLAVDVYQADAAPMVKLFPHRYVTVSGDTNYDLVGVDEDKFAVAWLRPPEVQELAKTGDADKEQVIGECALECRHNEAGFVTEKLL